MDDEDLDDEENNARMAQNMSMLQSQNSPEKQSIQDLNLNISNTWNKHKQQISNAVSFRSNQVTSTFIQYNQDV